MGNKVIHTENAPKAIGPYSQAVVSGGFVFVSGQLPVDPKTNEMREPDFTAQTKQSMENILSILKENNLTADNIVKTTIFVSDLGGFAQVNEAYAAFFDKTYPSRACVQVSRLPKDALVEIEAIASL
ncbi:RidA family protein [Caproiciproducens faecalis]|uniref:RidA family protein n=1 Tax=Caproiciproducens faecalis TaxID=2820301 RepID=A0ABS7DP41_9FIRM|nr:RidA family protein [Caproiciproducens faecalis]MBW7572963.1 RidA family protein [Caproiciproducens faecalis]